MSKFKELLAKIGTYFKKLRTIIVQNKKKSIIIGIVTAFLIFGITTGIVIGIINSNNDDKKPENPTTQSTVDTSKPNNENKNTDSNVTLTTPQVAITNPTKTQTSVGFTITEVDTDNVGTLTNIELLHANGTITSENLEQRTFENLLSNTNYTVKITYTYDLKNGEGEHTITDELLIKTDAKGVPSLTVKNENITANSILAAFDIVDADNVITSYDVKLYNNEVLVETNNYNRIEFSSLSYYTDYTVKISYMYDLNDGNGEQTKTVDYEFKTLPYIDILECSITNTSPVSIGELIFMSIKFNNPLGMNIESVVINGETYDTIQNVSSNEIIVKIPCDDHFPGGDTLLQIDRVNAKFYGYPFGAIPKNTLSDSIFVNGTVKVVKIELVNSEFEPYEDGSWIFPSETVYVLITLNNPTGYEIDSFDGYTKIDDNRYYYTKPYWSGDYYWSQSYGWSSNESISSLTYHNEYISNSIAFATVYSSNSVYKVKSNETHYVSTPDNLKNMDDGYYYELTGDIDLTGLEWQGSIFDGAFNGKGYAIKNMSFVGTVNNNSACLGLFSEGTGCIKNLKIQKATIIASITSDNGGNYSAYVGGIMASSCGKFSISDCEVDEYSVISITNHTRYGIYAGGLVGYDMNTSPSSIFNCTNNANVSVNSTAYDEFLSIFAGGLVGSSISTISNCTNNGDVSASALTSAYAGGLVGSGSSTITNCINNGDISVSSSYITYAGGLVGSGISTISNCTNNGDVSASSSYAFAGGVLAYVGSSRTASISNCTNTGNVSATSYYSSHFAGGLASNGPVTITNSYSTVFGNATYNGESCTIEQLNSKEFYTETLGWSEEIWDLSDLDIANGKYPKLR